VDVNHAEGSRAYASETGAIVAVGGAPVRLESGLKFRGGRDEGKDVSFGLQRATTGKLSYGIESWS